MSRLSNCEGDLTREEIGGSGVGAASDRECRARGRSGGGAGSDLGSSPTRVTYRIYYLIFFWVGGVGVKVVKRQ